MGCHDFVAFFLNLVIEASDRPYITYIDAEFHVESISDVFRKIREHLGALKPRNLVIKYSQMMKSGCRNTVLTEFSYFD